MCKVRNISALFIYIIFSEFMRHCMAWVPSVLSFVNHPADSQLISKGQTSNGVSLFITRERQLIMVASVRQVWFRCLDVIKTF